MPQTSQTLDLFADLIPGDTGTFGFALVHEKQTAQRKKKNEADSSAAKPNAERVTASELSKQFGAVTGRTFDLFQELPAPAPKPVEAPAVTVNDLPKSSAAGRELARKKQAEELAKPVTGLMRTIVNPDHKIVKKPLTRFVDDEVSRAIKASQDFNPWGAAVRARLQEDVSPEPDEAPAPRVSNSNFPKPRA
jgi:hypothetical protein